MDGHEMDIEDRTQFREDFDRIALFPEAAWNHNTHYHEYLLRHIPQRCEHVLEIGCGKGGFTRRVADRAKQISAIDLSPAMLRYAREDSAEYHNIEYRLADFIELPLLPESYDCIVTIATLHHIPLEHAVQKMRSSLKPGGVLAVLDLYQEEGTADALRGLLAAGVHRYLSFTRNPGYRISAEEQRLWDQHGEQESYPRFPALREMCHRLLPGAILKKHLLWRYSLIWQKEN